jgi:hypothetical protein
MQGIGQWLMSILNPTDGHCRTPAPGGRRHTAPSPEGNGGQPRGGPVTMRD